MKRKKIVLGLPAEHDLAEGDFMPELPGEKRRASFPAAHEERRRRMCRFPAAIRPGFTLIELLIVIAIIAAAVMYLLWVQVITFIQDVALEVAYRVQQA